MLNRIKSELLNFGLKFISVDEKLVRMFLETSPSNISEIVILPAIKMVMKKLVNKLKNKRCDGRVYNGLLNGVRVSVIRSLVGCPNCAITIECLKRCKTKAVIRIDFCGGIESDNIKIGDILIPKSAYCGDGTTPLYFLKNPALSNQLKHIPNPITRFQTMMTGSQTIFISKPNSGLKNLLLSEGRIMFPNITKEVNLWTTDALFCETYEFIKSLESSDVHGIDMESSSLFLLGNLFNLKTASILAVSDLPGHSQYDMFNSNEIHPDIEGGIDNAIKILLKCLPKLSDQF